MSDLQDHFARLSWAQAETTRLAAAVEQYENSRPIQIYWHYEFNRVQPMKIYRWKLDRDIPVDVSIHAGSIIHELRATLDSLICTLAKRNGAPTLKDTYFPTGKSEEVFLKELQRKLKYVSAGDKEIITSLRAYPGGNDMLYALHSSDLIGKHQRLIVLTGDVSSTILNNHVLDGSAIDFIRGGVKTADEPLARVTIDYDLNLELHPEIAFAEPSAIERKPLVATLNDFASLVDSILKLFV